MGKPDGCPPGASIIASCCGEQGLHLEPWVLWEEPRSLAASLLHPENVAWKLRAGVW